MTRAAESDVLAAFKGRDEAAFVTLVETYRRELQMHCYRMVGSLEDSEDLVQETVLRAWRARESFEGRSSVKSWLYRIATNACLDLLRHRSPRLLPPDVLSPANPHVGFPDRGEAQWLDPYPSSLIERIPASGEDPEAELVNRETIELAFLAAIQHLTPNSRAVLILRDVLGWSAKETAATLGFSVASVNSSLQRARETLKQRLPPRRVDWRVAAHTSEAERRTVQRYMHAHEQGDVEALAQLLREDARISAPPFPVWYSGRDDLLASAKRYATAGRYRYILSGANGQPAAASYVRRDADGPYTPLGIDVLRIEGEFVAEVTAFLRPDLFPTFGLPASLG
jgi:RNA polymerase sigma-70 factor (ECF subfamily)